MDYLACVELHVYGVQFYSNDFELDQNILVLRLEGSCSLLESKVLILCNPTELPPSQQSYYDFNLLN